MLSAAVDRGIAFGRLSKNREGRKMIVRLWRGWTKLEDADGHEEHLKPELLPGLSSVSGEDYERAVIPEERRKYLKRFEERAAHFEVVAKQ